MKNNTYTQPIQEAEHISSASPPFTYLKFIVKKDYTQKLLVFSTRLKINKKQEQ